MKLCAWLVILALTFWSLDKDHWISRAYGATVVTTYVTSVSTAVTTMKDALGNIYTATSYPATTQTVITTMTGTSTSTGTGGKVDAKEDGQDCQDAGNLYGGASNFKGACSREKNTQQRNTQDDTKDNNNQGADKSTALGLAAIAAGMAMVAAGVALLPNPPTTPIGIALIAAGMALIAAGMAALAAAKKMNQNANKANKNANNLDNLASKPYKSTISDGKGDAGTDTSELGTVGKNDLGDGNTSGIKIDPALLRSGKFDSIFGDMEKKTGIGRDDFAKAMTNGGDPLNLLSNSPAMRGKPAGSEANLNKMFDDATSKGVPSGQEVMDKLGLTNGDLNGVGKDENAVNMGGSDANRNMASAGPNIDSLFPGQAVGAAPTTGGNDFKLSSEVQAALDKNGITGRSIFEMVHQQYIKKTPLMFGVTGKVDGTKDNPYQGLNPANKMEF